MEAGGFRHSVNVLIANLETKPNGMPKNMTWEPLYLLASHAAELYLKASLLKRGHTESELRASTIRHNLSALATLLQSHVAISETTRITVDRLSNQHRHHFLRYGVPEGKVALIPHPRALEGMLDELLNHCRVGGT